MSSSLDLSAPLAPAASATSSSLDLSAPASGPASAPAEQRIHVTHRTVRRGPEFVEPRVASGSRMILSVKAPTVTLTRLQSGVGSLRFEAASSSSVGDLRLGCAYQLRDGHASTAQHAQGNRYGPKSSKRPVVITARNEFEEISLDLRQNHSLERLLIYAFSESGAYAGSVTPLNWGGTFVVTTFGGARIEVPIDLAPSTGTLAVMSLYNIGGEFVLRAEMELISGPIREACKAYGYDRISWLDDHSPVE
ncbi:Uncharacterized protein involved in tellurium resistance [Frankineae bacterium MT45]|nr:Uncharacterized protein involved in tellurium resistance [Frankineae bacterium MT45]